MYELLHPARAVLLNLGKPAVFDITPWADRVDLLDAKHTGAWELPVIGEVDAPSGAHPPDGHVAWTGEPGEPELADALERWFGAPLVA